MGCLLHEVTGNTQILGWVDPSICTQVLGLRENYAALIVPLLVSPFNIIIMRTFFKSSVPLELIEAATIDGSGEYSTFFRVVLPIAKPGLATIALLNALAYWNDWTNGLYYISRHKEFYNVQNLLNQMVSNIQYLATSTTNSGMASALGSLPATGIQMAIAFVAILPIMLIFPLFQKYYAKGISVGAVK